MSQAIHDLRTWVSFQTLADGSVQIVATGRNGTLTRHIDGSEEGPTMDIPDLDKEPGRRFKYKGAWGLEANGKLKGWLVDDNGKIKWFAAPATRTPSARQAKARETKQTAKGKKAEPVSRATGPNGKKL